MSCCEDERESISNEYVHTDTGDGELLTYYFHGEVDGDRVAALIEILFYWDSEHPDSSWEIVICSPGGEMKSGTALFSVLRRYSIRGGGSHHITMRVAGQTCSVASLILQAGDHRVMGPMDFIMIHEPTMAFTYETSEVLRHKINHCDMWESRYLDVLAERATRTAPEIKRKYQGRDWWIPADEALDLGFIDEVSQ